MKLVSARLQNEEIKIYEQAEKLVKSKYQESYTQRQVITELAQTYIKVQKNESDKKTRV